MSTRWYPLYAKGNPQLRVFLPNFWMKLTKQQDAHPPNVAQFIVSMEMTREDVKNYLEKIYKIPVVSVKTKVFTGAFKKAGAKNYLIKEDDYRKAYVTMEKDFKFPDLFPPNDRMEKALKDQELQEKEYRKQKLQNVDRQDVPTWFGA